jgi:hypothetical protein
MWEYPPNVSLYVCGDGRLILQAYPVIPDDPDNPMVMTRRNGLVPTCKNKLASDDVSALIRLMIETACPTRASRITRLHWSEEA